MLAALQAQIVKDTPSDGPDAGAIRETQVFIGAKDRRLAEARFIPPPPGTSCAQAANAGWTG